MVVIIDYGLGNLFSVAKAFQRIGAEARISGDPEDLRQAERLVLPGVGAFGDGMENLRAKGLIEALKTEVLENKKPFLGICLGLQLLAEKGYEYGEHGGLGFVRGDVRKLKVESFGLKVPHIGWNEVEIVREHSLFAGFKPKSEFYFLHSYQLDCGDGIDRAATAEYGETITAAIARDNMFATQFHPEKSQEAGLKLLENFIHWNP